MRLGCGRCFKCAGTHVKEHEAVSGRRQGGDGGTLCRKIDAVVRAPARLRAIRTSRRVVRGPLRKHVGG